MSGRMRKQKRLESASAAVTSEFQRIIVGNKELIAEIIKLRQRYEIDDMDGYQSANWFGSQPLDKLALLSKDLKEIQIRYGLSDSMQREFQHLIFRLDKFRNENLSVKPTFKSLGLPIVRFMKEGNGEVTAFIMITAETDMDNQNVINFIKSWQRARMGNPPQPIQIDHSRKQDWRPVWEWNMRHPFISRDEIADMLIRDRDYVRRKLEELDNEAFLNK